MDEIIEHLSDGAVLKTLKGEKVEVVSALSFEGGQGDVYKARWAGREYALKWYNRTKTEMTGSGQYKNIKALVDKFSRIASSPEMKNYIVPAAIVTESGREVAGRPFGYLMELLPKNSYELKYMFQGDTKPDMPRFQSVHARVWAGLHMMSSVRALHNMGLSYKDFSAGNISADPATGAVKMVDCDNISDSLAPCFVSGTQEYMAPEIIRSGYRTVPNINTDQYSEAVVLFRLFYLDHPMEGQRFADFRHHDGKNAEELYGLHPIYCMAENDKRNRPGKGFAPNVYDRMKIFPASIRPGFEKTFVNGISNPGGRTDENTWIRLLSELRDTLVFLSVEPVREVFVNFANPRSIPAGCLRLSMVKGASRSQIAIYPRQSIFKNSVTGINSEYDKRIGYVYGSAKKPGIQNLSGETWTVFDPRTKKMTDVPDKGLFEVTNGLQIRFSKEPAIVGVIDDPAAAAR